MQLSESILHYQRNACYAAVQQLIAVTTTTYNMCDIKGAIIAQYDTAVSLGLLASLGRMKGNIVDLDRKKWAINVVMG